MKWLILILVNFMNVSNEIDLLNWNFSFNWNEWSNCSSLCGTGFMSRTRACLTCFNNSLILQTQSCISNASCKDNSTSSSFQSASITATLVNEQTLKPSTLKPSQSVLTQTLTVPDQTVKVLNSYIDGGVWMQWSNWSKCIQSCGTSMMNRSRACNTKNNFYNCSGNSTEMLTCFSNETCVSFWAQWSNWSECMPSCGQSVMIRGRVCNGTNCSGNSTEKTTCFSNITCIAFWTQWGKWSECMPSCGKSVMIRERVCNGTNCSGNSTEKITCFSNITCMEEWSMWSDCSTTCGEGNKTSYELKANNAKTRVEYCSLVNCPVDGMWSLWSNSWCSTTCGGGKIVYSRVCDNPIPAYHGDDCMGISNYTEDCEDSTICPVNGGWSSWSFWSLCNQPCEGGLMSRFRNCSNPTSQYGGLNCNGNSMETVNCSWKFCKKVDLNLEVYFVDEEYNDGYVRLTSDPTFELKERFIKAISKLYQNSKVVANFSVELHSIRNDVP
ncbi:coadhesin-like isoform X3 [Hydra vulgaris]|uniref:Coadhesin-like isoform X3 n=1 Tax=Hydra vulgaris TaxID=6087 RepID=A0ABM4BWJ6_HYDVU